MSYLKHQGLISITDNLLNFCLLVFSKKCQNIFEDFLLKAENSKFLILVEFSENIFIKTFLIFSNFWEKNILKISENSTLPKFLDDQRSDITESENTKSSILNIFILC